MKTLQIILFMLFAQLSFAQIKQKTKTNVELGQSMGSGLNWNSTLQINVKHNYFLTFNLNIYNPIAKDKPENYFHKYSGGLLSKQRDQQDNYPIDKHKFIGISFGKKYYFPKSFFSIESSVGIANMQGSYLIFLNQPYSHSSGNWFPSYDSSNYTAYRNQYQNKYSFQSRLKIYRGMKNRRVQAFMEVEAQLNPIHNMVVIGFGLKCRLLSL